MKVCKAMIHAKHKQRRSPYILTNFIKKNKKKNKEKKILKKNSWKLDYIELLLD